MKKVNASRKSVLLIEDEPAISKFCVRILSAEGFEVDSVVNGKVARHALEKKQYDLCLVDIRTPEMNGMEFYQYLKKEHPELTNKIIFTTGDLLTGDTKAFLEETNRPYLPKPFAPDELRAIVRAALSVSQPPVRQAVRGRIEK